MTHNSITIDWSDPSGNLKHVFPNSPFYRVCWKKSWALPDTCNTNSTYTSQKPFPITGLASETPYKIKVYTYTLKKNRWGQWKNPEYRKVGTTTATTQQAPGSPRIGGVHGITASATSLTVRVEWSHPSDFVGFRVCYKKTWVPIELHDECKVTPGSSSGLYPSDEELGFLERVPAALSADFTMLGLAKCRQYKIVGYGYASNGSVVFIGETLYKTTGSCSLLEKLGGPFKTVDVELVAALIDDYDQVAQEYLGAVDGYYARRTRLGLVGSLAARYPVLREAIAFFATGGESLAEEANLLEYLREAQPSVLSAWQAELDLVKGRLSASLWLQDNHPNLLRQLLDERELVPVVGPAVIVPPAQ